MSIKNYLTRIKTIGLKDLHLLQGLAKLYPFSLLVLGVAIGSLAVYLYFQPKLIYQEKLAKNMTALANKNMALAVQSQKEASASGLLLASASAQIKDLLARPPQVEYKTQYVPQVEYQTQYVQTPAPQTQIHCTDNGFTGLLHQMNCTSY